MDCLGHHGGVDRRQCFFVAVDSALIAARRQLGITPSAPRPYEALQRAKAESNHVMVVADHNKREPGILTVNDVLLQLLRWADV